MHAHTHIHTVSKYIVLGWKKYRRNTGKTLEDQTFPSGKHINILTQHKKSVFFLPFPMYVVMCTGISVHTTIATVRVLFTHIHTPYLTKSYVPIR